VTIILTFKIFECQDSIAKLTGTVFHGCKSGGALNTGAKPQAKQRPAAPGASRAALLGDVAMAMREVTSLSVLYHQMMAQRLGVNSTDLQCLERVAANRNVTAGDLARVTGLTSGSITTVIDRLEQAGFVSRLRNDVDRRKVFVAATPAMRRQTEPLSAPMHDAIGEVLGRCGEDRLKFLSHVLQELCAAVNKAIAQLNAMSDSPAVKRPPV
jgi:DNA-binding MarR family transcriptional regulator